MSQNIIRKSLPAVRSALGDFIGRKVREGTHGDPKRDYDKCSVSSIVAGRSRRGNIVATVTFMIEGCCIYEFEFGGGEVSFYHYPEEWRLVIRESDGHILSSSSRTLENEGWYDSYGF